MRVILSRKGFDSQYGGMPSPILPDGTLLSLPIPSKTDMETGTAAGMHTIGALWGFRDREELESSGAEIVAENPENLLKIYEELNYDKTGCK